MATKIDEQNAFPAVDSNKNETSNVTNAAPTEVISSPNNNGNNNSQQLNRTPVVRKEDVVTPSGSYYLFALLSFIFIHISSFVFNLS